MKASERIDVEDAILSQRRIPCICDRQWDEDRPVPLGKATARHRRGDQIIEHVTCDHCEMTWTRITVVGEGETPS